MATSTTYYLQVASMVLGTTNAGKGKKNGQAVVTVVDDFGNTISGATVSGTFTGSFNESETGNTGGSGAVTLTTSNNPVKRNIAYTFCVDSISGVPGLIYSPSAADCQTY